MKNFRAIGFLICGILVASSLAAITGITSSDGNGPYNYISIRGKVVSVYGKGLYRHMSAEVAPQGIAQDYVTIFIAIPLLLVSWIFAYKGSVRARIILTGTTGYFLVTYLFYLVMGMYNSMFLAYVLILSCSFFAFILLYRSFSLIKLSKIRSSNSASLITGVFLIVSTIIIGLLWLSIIIPPLLNGSIIPVQVEHYTTLIVQGLDLAVLLPSGFVAGLLLLKRKPAGVLLASVYIVFLSLLMMALVAKIIAMAILGYNVIPVIYIIPVFAVIAIMCTMLMLRLNLFIN